MPRRQDDLIDAVTAVNPRTIVVLNTGDPVTMPWIAKVPAILEMWYPGQRVGEVTAALLLGDVSPSGKLPVTFPVRIEDNPTFSADLRAAMIEITFDPAVKAVSVTADGKVFCAGGDLKLFHEAGDELPTVAAAMLVDFHGAINTMNTIPKPFVAGVRGAAGGAGLSLMSAFDLVVAGESSKFTMAYTRAGVGPIGVFTVAFGPDSPTFWVLLPHKSIQSVVELDAKLQADPKYKAAPFLQLPSSDPGYVRIDSQLMVAFRSIPALEKPAGALAGRTSVVGAPSTRNPAVASGKTRRRPCRSRPSFRPGEWCRCCR